MKKYFELSMMNLLERKSIDEITVNELIEEVGSCKGTFYKHYVDKYDLCCKCLKNNVYNQISFDVLNWEEFMIQCLNVFEKYSNVVMHAFDSVDINSTRHFHEQSVTKLLENIIKANGGDATCELNKYSLQFCGVAITDITYKWIKDGRKESKESVLKLLRAVMPQSIYKQVYAI
ncbi:MAG: TetR/AcrR family transcriptional regulator [Clostridia bacterium]|nr:TetR/AcrR family transcriptional regulator [Clostridia bacterium]